MAIGLNVSRAVCAILPTLLVGCGLIDAGRTEPSLVGTAVVRYYMSQNVSLVDAVLPRLDLPATSNDLVEVRALRTGDALHWSSQGGDFGFCATEFDKLRAAIDGSPASTIETVVTVDGAVGECSRLVHAGFSSSSSYTLCHTGDELLFIWADAAEFSSEGFGFVGWPVPQNDLGQRTVLTVVVDFARPNAEKVRLFVDGRIYSGETSSIDLGDGGPVLLDEATDFCVGNRGAGSRSIAGDIGYAAVYGHALTPEQVQRNAARLLLCDDAVCSVPTTDQ